MSYLIWLITVISIAVYAWSHYEDRGLPIIKTSFQDTLHGTYAIWRKGK